MSDKAGVDPNDGRSAWFHPAVAWARIMSIGRRVVALATLGACVWLYWEGRVTGMQAIGLAFLGGLWIELVFS